MSIFLFTGKLALVSASPPKFSTVWFLRCFGTIQHLFTGKA